MAAVPSGRVIRSGEGGYDQYVSVELGTCPKCFESLAWALTEDESFWNFGPDDGAFSCCVCGARFEVEQDGDTDSGFSYHPFPLE